MTASRTPPGPSGTDPADHPADNAGHESAPASTSSAPSASAPSASAPSASAPSASAPSASAPALVRAVGDLERHFRDQVRNALKVDLDGSVTSLAFVDHYLGMARGETRRPILDLLAASAGAYFGELVRREFGGTWVGRPDDPPALRLLLGAVYMHFAPIALAYAAILGAEPDDDALDCALHLDIRGGEPDGKTDAEFIEERLLAAPPVPEDQFYSLTTRFETIALIVDLLAARRAQSGSEPYTYTIDDYSHALS